MNTCETCNANKVCDHDKHDFETCGNYISEDVVEVVKNKIIKTKILETKIAQLEKKLEEVTEKHWNECRQISSYDLEASELKEKIEKLKMNNALMRSVIFITNEYFDACADVLKSEQNPLDNNSDL